MYTQYCRDEEEKVMKEVFTEALTSQLRSSVRLDTTLPYRDVIIQASQLLANYHSLVSFDNKSHSYHTSVEASNHLQSWSYELKA